jgi:4-amino-4-deoxy-L-arabinose transferase-like glycosyltransferase
VLLLLALFPLLYLANLGVQELRSQEALLASIATDVRAGDNLLMTTVHGEQVPAFPVYPWLIRICSAFQHPNEWTIRLPAALAVLGLAALAGLTASNAAGNLAGLVAASMVLTSVACLREGVVAGDDTLFAFFLGAAWLAWFWFGRERQTWWLAWLVSLTAVLLATFTSGIQAFVCFYLPLLFVRRPLRRWQRFFSVGHIVALALAVAVLIYWHRTVPGQTLLPWSTLVLRAVPEDTGSYVAHLVSFPLKSVVLVLPWLFLAWPGFCLAYRPLEKNPVFCHFLRTILFSLFLASWALPRSSPRVLMPLIGPLAILTAVHYEILVRRHYLDLQRLIRVLAGIAVALAGLGSIASALHLTGLVDLSGWSARTTTVMLALLVVAGGVSWWGHRHASLRPVWVMFLLSFSMMCLVQRAVHPPWQAWLGNSRRGNAEILRAEVPETETVHKTVRRLMLAECFYLQRRIRQIADLDQDLPEDAPTVYVLGGEKPPILPTRSWRACSKRVDLRLHASPFAVWLPGGRCLVRITPVPAPRTEPEREGTVCMYRGDLR